MNNDQSTGMSWLAVLFIIIVIAALFGGFGNGFGFGRGNMPYPVNDTAVFFLKQNRICHHSASLPSKCNNDNAFSVRKQICRFGFS